MTGLLDFLTQTHEQFCKARLSSLYSDFRAQRITNPDGYKANVAAWQSGLAAAARAEVLPDGLGTCAVQIGPRLETALRSRDFGVPQALKAVAEDSVMHGHMIPLQHFLHSPRSINDKSWDLSPKAVLLWGMRQIGMPLDLRDTHGQYVLVSNLSALGNQAVDFLSNKSSLVDRIMPMTSFREELTTTLSLKRPMSSPDLEILLKYLARDMGMIAYDHNVVKVKAATEREATLTAEDINICSIKSLIVDLSAQTESISTRIDEITLKAKIAVMEKKRRQAASALRSKRLHETLLIRRSATLTQLEEIFNKIAEAADQVEVVNAMQIGTEVLRGLNKKVGSLETVETLLNSLHDEMVQTQEVKDVINQEAQLGRVDETEIDEELEAMEREAQEAWVESNTAATRDRLAALDQAEAKNLIAESTGTKPKVTVKDQGPEHPLKPSREAITG